MYKAHCNFSIMPIALLFYIQRICPQCAGKNLSGIMLHYVTVRNKMISFELFPFANIHTKLKTQLGHKLQTVAFKSYTISIHQSYEGGEKNVTNINMNLDIVSVLACMYFFLRIKFRKSIKYGSTFNPRWVDMRHLGGGAL